MLEQEPEPEPEMPPPDDDVDFGWEECEDDTEDLIRGSRWVTGCSSDDGLSDDDFPTKIPWRLRWAERWHSCRREIATSLLSGVFDVYQPYTTSGTNDSLF